MKVILGVTGCVAAYKAAEIVRRLQDRGCEVFPVMTASAQNFITPLTLEKLSGNSVVRSLFQERSSRIEHISLARETDLLLVAPATANILAKFAAGIADDFLTTLYVSNTNPVIVAPAMNVEMWKHPATRHNLDVLRSRAVQVVEPESGYLACGEFGEGRLAPVQTIVEEVARRLEQKDTLAGKTILVTAGPTVEDIDPIRHISNRSSGKMGYALAAEAAQRGGQVLLVSGPSRIDPPPGVSVQMVRSAAEMRSAVQDALPRAQILIMAAAVADYRPVRPSTHKIKKSEAAVHLELERTADILMEASRVPGRRYLVGFAAETENLLDNARKKLIGKNLDMIVANDIGGQTGIEVDDNQAVLLTRDGASVELPRQPKRRLASAIWDQIENRLESLSAAESTGGDQH